MRTITEIFDGLKAAPAILADFIRAIETDRLDVRRGEGFWTIAEHASHLAHVQPMLLERIQRFQEEDQPQFIPFIPADDLPDADLPATVPIDTALAQFTSVRNAQVALLARVDDDAWRKTATHPEYEDYNLPILVRHILMHDHWHMYRMEELWLTRDAYLTRLEG